MWFSRPTHSGRSLASRPCSWPPAVPLPLGFIRQFSITQSIDEMQYPADPDMYAGHQPQVPAAGHQLPHRPQEIHLQVPQR
eukprot:scaffold187738_cov14-Tisochrysis_lutea.AAC.1